MKQKDLDILSKDLCTRIPYGVKVQTNYNGIDEPIILESVSPYTNSYSVRNRSAIISGISFDTHKCKPYLFPLSSMTEKQEKEFEDNFITYHPYITGGWYCLKYMSSYYAPIEIIDWLNKNHFDYRNLIERNLAIDCTNLNVY